MDEKFEEFMEAYGVGSPRAAAEAYGRLLRAQRTLVHLQVLMGRVKLSLISHIVNQTRIASILGLETHRTDALMRRISNAD